MKHYREDLVGEALEKLQDEHGIKREGISCKPSMHAKFV